LIKVKCFVYGTVFESSTIFLVLRAGFSSKDYQQWNFVYWTFYLVEFCRVFAVFSLLFTRVRIECEWSTSPSKHIGIILFITSLIYGIIVDYLPDLSSLHNCTGLLWNNYGFVVILTSKSTTSEVFP